MSSLSAPHHAFAHGGNESSVIGHEVTLGPLEARFAMQRELDSAAAALAGGSEMFDPCAEAVVLFSEWTMNYVRRSSRPTVPQSFAWGLLPPDSQPRPPMSTATHRLRRLPRPLNPLPAL